MGSPVDDHEHQLVVAQLEGEAAAVERLAGSYAGLAQARYQASDADQVRVSPGQLRLVVGE